MKGFLVKLDGEETLLGRMVFVLLLLLVHSVSVRVWTQLGWKCCARTRMCESKTMKGRPGQRRRNSGGSSSRVR